MESVSPASQCRSQPIHNVYIHLCSRSLSLRPPLAFPHADFVWMQTITKVVSQLKSPPGYCEQEEYIDQISVTVSQWVSQNDYCMSVQQCSSLICTHNASFQDRRMNSRAPCASCVWYTYSILMYIDCAYAVCANKENSFPLALRSSQHMGNSVHK